MERLPAELPPDPVGNRLTQNRVGTTTNVGNTTYTYNNADQLMTSVIGTTTTTYAYDDDGNQTRAGSQGYVYDLNNKLTRYCPATATCTNTVIGRTEYTYDGQGKRLTKATSGVVDTRFSWDPVGSLPELALERTGANALIRRYLQGPFGPISYTTSAGTFYYHPDAIGSIRTVTSSTGAEQWQYDYDPHGEARTTTKVVTTAPANLVQFAGEASDAETGDYHLRARQYRSTLGRSTAIDPKARASTLPTVGAYSYADGQPLVLTDPDGLEPGVGGGQSQISGAQAEEAVVERLRGAGLKVAERISFRLPSGLRIQVDITIGVRRGGSFIAGEVKANGSRRTAKQTAKYQEFAQHGGKAVGNNAKAAGYALGQTYRPLGTIQIRVTGPHLKNPPMRIEEAILPGQGVWRKIPPPATPAPPDPPDGGGSGGSDACISARTNAVSCTDPWYGLLSWGAPSAKPSGAGARAPRSAPRMRISPRFGFVW